jgi:hypothetical protein
VRDEQICAGSHVVVGVHLSGADLLLHCCYGRIEQSGDCAHHVLFGADCTLAHRQVLGGIKIVTDHDTRQEGVGEEDATVAHSDTPEALWERLRQLLASGAIVLDAMPVAERADRFAEAEMILAKAKADPFESYFSGATNRRQRRGNENRPRYNRGRMQA